VDVYATVQMQLGIPLSKGVSTCGKHSKSSPPSRSTVRNDSPTLPMRCGSSQRGLFVAENAQIVRPVSQIHFVISYLQKLQLLGHESRASLQQGRPVLRGHSLGLLHSSDPSGEIERHAVRRTFSISKSMASFSFSTPTHPTLATARTPCPAAPPPFPPRSHLIASSSDFAGTSASG